MTQSTNAIVAVDEELWFGNVGDDKELEERAAQSMAAVAARVLGAKPFPAAARKLEELTRDVSTKIEQSSACSRAIPASRCGSCVS